VAVIDGQEQVRDEGLCAEIIRTARLSSPRRGRRASWRLSCCSCRCRRSSTSSGL